jgi:hypothetical protein
MEACSNRIHVASVKMFLMLHLQAVLYSISKIKFGSVQPMMQHFSLRLQLIQLTNHIKLVSMLPLQ